VVRVRATGVPSCARYDPQSCRYGRVLVERVRGLVSNETWQRAYREINDLEQVRSGNPSSAGVNQ
jgi:hypothetical protein